MVRKTGPDPIDDYEMPDEYDLSDATPIPNPFAPRGRKQITMRLDAEAIEYFKEQASKVGIPYQSLINMYLMDCAQNKKQLEVSWK